MSRRIVILGANGQVASEVTLILHQLGMDVVPICRGPMGASFLRYMGVPVRIGAVERPEEAARLIGDAAVVANFALAAGTPSEIRRQHDEILANSFDRSPADAKIVFFSTLAVNRGFNEKQRGTTIYGREKLRNERSIARLASLRRREALVLRLGHVCGELQGISLALRALIADGAVWVPDPERHANVVATATIADALIGVAEGRVPASGRFDLVNVPRWSWRDVLEFEARRAGVPLGLEARASAPAPKGGGSRWLRGLAGRAFNSQLMKRNADRALALVSDQLNARVAAQYRLRQAARDIGALHDAGAVPIEAAIFPGLETHVPPGLRDTAPLLGDPFFSVRIPPGEQRWADPI